MIIVSQDKYNILNFATTVNIGVEEITTLADSVQISAQTNGNTVVLGKYNTENRAKEVLQEITNTFSAGLLNGTHDEIDLILKAKAMARYEMPKE